MGKQDYRDTDFLANETNIIIKIKKTKFAERCSNITVQERIIKGGNKMKYKILSTEIQQLGI